MANPLIAAIMAAQSSEPEPEEIAWLWPCNVPAWRVWGELQTQWRNVVVGGIGGSTTVPTGMDYAAVRAHLDELGLCGDERREIYAGIRAAEHATLQAKAEQAEKTQ